MGDCSEIFHNIHVLRLSKGYSQASFAKLINMSEVHYGRIERGERDISLDRFYQIVNALESTPRIVAGPALECTRLKSKKKI